MPYCCRAVPPSPPLQIPCDGPAFGGRAGRVVSDRRTMSHSPTDQERAWNFGMVDSDVIAFPVCTAGEEKLWSSGRLKEPVSYWHEPSPGPLSWTTL